MRLRGYATAVAACCSLVFGGCTKPNAEAADSTTVAGDSGAPSNDRAVALPVAAGPARDGDLVLSIFTTGQIRSDGEATLRAEVAGTISKVLVRPGDRVTQGQELVSLDQRSFDLAVQEAEAAVNEATVRFEDEILPESIVTKRAPTPERRRNALARSGLQSARVRLEKAKLDRERSTIIAPFDGIVDRIEVSAGERVQGGEVVTTVVSLGDLRIEASVLEHDLSLIKVGGEALITSAAARDRPVTGRIAAVLPMVDSATRAGRAYVRIPSNRILRPGMYADVRLEAQRLTNRRLVPARAVIERDGRPLVFVVKDGRAQWVYILPGRTNGIETEVLPDSATGQIPVAPGDEVIVQGHLTLTHDAPVKVTSTGDAARREP